MTNQNSPQLSIQSLIADAITKLGFAPSESVHLEHPAVAAHGDWSTNIALVLFSQQPQPPQYQQPWQLAQALVAAMQAHLQPEGAQTAADAEQAVEPSLIQKIEIAGPGFINFTLTDAFWLNAAQQLAIDPQAALKKAPADSQKPAKQARAVVMEYSSPNIAKPFTIGHLRSTIIGDAVGNLLAATGDQVFRDNHLGDWGTQFGKQIYAIKTWGDEAKLDASSEPVKELVALYIKFHQEAEKDPELEEEGRKWFKRLEDGDPEARRLWQKCVDWSLKEFERIYTKLGVRFTENGGHGYGESYFEKRMTPVLEELRAKKLLQTSQDSQVVFFPEDKYPPLMLVKKDGATLYATRDLATDKFRLGKYHPDLVINEVGAEQTLYFQQLYEVEQMLGWYKPGQRVHVKHGHFRFKDKKMSTRKGNVIWLEDVIAEAEKRAGELLASKQAKVEKEAQPAAETPLDPTAAAKIGVGALKWNDLKRSSVLDVVFDWDEMLALQGNSGPYMQYTYARCCSVLAKAGKIATAQLPSDYVLNTEEKAVFRLLERFLEVVWQASAEMAPHHVCTLLFELAQRYNAFYNLHSILSDSSGEATVAVRVLLTQSTAAVIRTGLALLGIQTLERM